jgi:hypothetical protein
LASKASTQSLTGLLLGRSSKFEAASVGGLF